MDIPVPMYEFSTEEVWKEWFWNELYPGQKELLAYFAHVDKILDVKKDVSFGMRVVEAYFKASENKWIVRTENGLVARTRFLVSCLGFGSKPYIPDLPNLSSFRGCDGVHHTARWPQDKAISFKGKRVGVIGSGASGVQIVQTLASKPKDEALEQLTVFQRTPNLAIPMRQRNLDRETQEKEKEHYPTLYRRRRQTPSMCPQCRTFQNLTVCYSWSPL